jgi:tRNA-intron endonuclease
MDGEWRDDRVILGGDARQRFYDSRGYGRPLDDGGLALAPVEAAHLLHRGDLDSVDEEGFDEFLATHGDTLGIRFLVYSDLRERGFYLSPVREGWVDDPVALLDLIVHPRGTGPAEGQVEYPLRVVGERTSIDADSLGDHVLSVVDEEGEVTYFETGHPTIEGESRFDPPTAAGSLLADRVVVWDPPRDLYETGFYGQPLGGRQMEGALQLSLVEAAYLASQGTLSIDGGETGITRRGQDVEGERFDRRLAVYTALRDRAVVPKTGFKFGADFRTYSHVESIDELGHSENLVRVLPADYVLTPRELALDVRLAGGVRKRMVFALVDDCTIDWVSVGRLTP